MKAEGFAEDEGRKAAGLESSKAFVAMKFGEPWTSIFTKAIDPAIRAAGFEPVQLEFKEFNDDVIAEIFAGIRGSRFIIADFTGQSFGAYYEAGFAKGLGIEVIYTCKHDELKDAHFDTNHFSHIAWKDHTDLRNRLVTRINGTIGIGPLKAE